MLARTSEDFVASKSGPMTTEGRSWMVVKWEVGWVRVWVWTAMRESALEDQ